MLALGAIPIDPVFLPQIVDDFGLDGVLRTIFKLGDVANPDGIAR